jgi:dihydroneopterin aldolase
VRGTHPSIKEVKKLRQLFVFSIFLYLSLTGAHQTVNAESADDYGTVTSNTNKLFSNTYSMMDSDTHSPKMLLIEGEQAFRGGDLDIAMRKVKQSLALDNDDMDAHLLYASIMDEQLSNQSEKDPNLFNRTVEEWLDVMRNRYGEEKRMRWHGINPFGDLYHDDERSIPAKTALIKLTGSAPHTFETDAHYLKRVLMPATETVTAKVMKNGKTANPVMPVAVGQGHGNKANQ